jgi:alpha-L-rhamnosidase
MPSAPAADAALNLPFFWHPDHKPDEKEYYVAFRGEFQLPAAGEVTFRIFGATWFTGWIDDRYFCEGPARFPAAFPEYQTYVENLGAGRHVLAVQVRFLGAPTRSLMPINPFLACVALASGKEVALRWKCQRLAGYVPAVRFINFMLGYVEWCDTREVPEWRPPAFDDAKWIAPVAVQRPLGPLKPLPSANTRAIPHEIKLLAAGDFVETFGYDRDDPPARFFLRDLAPALLPPQGIWRRYDLGRVRLMRPRFELELPAGTVVEFAYSESLVSGRVNPWITLSTSTSCNLDHYVARGGRQEFFPLTPRGGRFLELHIFAPATLVKFHRESVLERVYYGEAAGALRTGDPLLDKIWSVGVETHRACAEDALTE